MNEGRVLLKEDFITKASEKYVLLTVDFPRAKEQSAELKAQNRELGTKFKIRGYPTFVVADADGEEKARSLGSPAGDVAGFLDWLASK